MPLLGRGIQGTSVPGARIRLLRDPSLLPPKVARCSAMGRWQQAEAGEAVKAQGAEGKGGKVASGRALCELHMQPSPCLVTMSMCSLTHDLLPSASRCSQHFGGRTLLQKVLH
eukprot:8591470-Alexandrium_andersonii.AAC.1